MTLRHLKIATAAVYGINVDDLTGPSRQQVFTHPRQLAMFIAYDRMNKTYPVIGRAFGNRDHTTAMHAKNAVERRMDAELRSDMGAIIAAIPTLQERELGGVFRSTRAAQPTFKTTRNS